MQVCWIMAASEGGLKYGRLGRRLKVWPPRKAA
jgi:hypothetical protein